MICRLYARYSTDRQSEASIADQIRICREYASARGWRVSSQHSDEGISGAALGNRPGANQALAALQAGDALLVSDLSRLSRSQDIAPLLSRLRHRGVRVIGVQDGFDSDARTARMQAGLSGIMSEEFRAMVGDRSWSALETRARDGRPTGGKAYENLEVIKEIFHRWADGDTLRAIASDLNRRGIPSPGAAWSREKRRKDGRWLRSSLHELLRNERYAGRLIWNRSRWVRDPDTGKRQRRERPREEWIVREIEPVIDRSLWDRAQSRFRPLRAGRGGAPRYLLSGLLTCGLCGSRLTVVGGSQHRYRCGSFSAGGLEACGNSASVPRKIAEDLILAPVVDDLLSPAAIEAGVRAMRQAAAPVPRENEEVVTLERLVRDGILSSDVARPALEEARRKAAEAMANQPALLASRPTPAAWRAAVAGMREILEGDDIPAARETLRALLGEIICRPGDGAMIAELTSRHVLLATGTGSWVGSGGAITIRLPYSSRQIAA